MATVENNTWPPPIKNQPSCDGSKDKIPVYQHVIKSGLLLGLILNGLVLMMSCHFLYAPRGSGIDVDPFFLPLILISAAGIFIGTPLAIRHIVVSIQKKQGMAIVALGIVSLTLNLDINMVSDKTFSYVVHSRSLHNADGCCSDQ